MYRTVMAAARDVPPFARSRARHAGQPEPRAAQPAAGRRPGYQGPQGRELHLGVRRRRRAWRDPDHDEARPMTTSRRDALKTVLWGGMASLLPLAPASPGSGPPHSSPGGGGEAPLRARALPLDAVGLTD